MRQHYPYRVLQKSLVQPYYRENSSILFFLFILLFGVVGEDNGAEIWQFHYSLALGLLEHEGYLGMVFIVWFLYARKCCGFVAALMRKPEYAFLTIYTRLSSLRRLGLFVYVSGLLFSPVIIYTLYLIGYGCLHHLYGASALVGGFLLLLWAGMAGWLLFCLSHRQNRVQALPFRWSPAYPVILLRYVARRQAAVWLGLKIFTCGCVFGIALNNTWDDYDHLFPFLFFLFGLMANGIIVFGIRKFEETEMAFYRGMPVRLIRRLGQYAVLYFVLLIPEFVTVIGLGPEHVHTGDIFCYCSCAYTLLLWMHCISCRRYFPPKEFLLVLVTTFAVGYIFMAGIGLMALAALLGLSAVTTFFSGYYRYHRGLE